MKAERKKERRGRLIIIQIMNALVKAIIKT